MLIEERDLKPYIARDSAHRLLQQFLKAYNAWRSNMGDEDEFDKCLQRGKIKIENTFGLLKNRWTILRAFNYNVKYA